ncbi:MAG: hypothetical protein H6742_10215 [Alphaproteobacteria bacterium]|nr:hypothetical protein [Alphaproteobacteria bacterium]
MSRLSRLPLLLALLFAGAFGLPAHAVDFSGRWSLDKAASGSMDPILELQGVAWAKRKLAEGLDAKVAITQTADRMTAAYDNAAGKQQQVLVFDGRPHSTVNPAGIETTFSTSWQDGENRLVSSGPASGQDGAAGTLTETRTLSADGATLTVVVEVKLSDGRSARTTRVFRRAA